MHCGGTPAARVTSSRSMIVPIACHQFLVQGQQNHADLKTRCKRDQRHVSPARMRPASNSSTSATVWVVEAVFP